MTYQEIMQIIQESYTNDWNKSYSGLSDSNIWYYTQDVDLRIEHSDEDILSDDFKAGWLKHHDNKSASSYYYRVYYRNTLIVSIVLVLVDGGRALLPKPEHDTNTVKEFDYKIAQIVETTEDSLNEYMKRSGLEVKR